MFLIPRAPEEEKRLGALVQLFHLGFPTYNGDSSLTGWGLRYQGSLPSHDPWSNFVSQRPLGASSQRPQQCSAFGENSPKICTRLLDPFTPINWTFSLSLSQPFSAIAVYKRVCLLAKLTEEVISSSPGGSLLPGGEMAGHRLSHRAPQLSNTSAWPPKRITSQRKGHRGSLRENGVLSGRCAFRIRQTGRGTWGAREQLQGNHDHAWEACTLGNANGYHTSTVAADTSLRT